MTKSSSEHDTFAVTSAAPRFAPLAQAAFFMGLQLTTYLAHRQYVSGEIKHVTRFPNMAMACHGVLLELERSHFSECNATPDAGVHFNRTMWKWDRPGASRVTMLAMLEQQREGRDHNLEPSLLRVWTGGDEASQTLPRLTHVKYKPQQAATETNTSRSANQSTTQPNCCKSSHTHCIRNQT